MTTEPTSSLPLVTAVITTHRRPALLARALASVRAERYSNVEIIVAEDGTELTRAGVAGQPHALLVQRRVGGCAAARNLGLDFARGRFVIFLDDDDTARPNRIADLLPAALEGNAVSYGRTLKRVPEPAAIPAHPAGAGPVCFEELLVHMPHVDAVLIATEALREVGGFDVTTPNFDEFSAWLRILDRGGTAHFTDTIVADWHHHEEGLTGAMVRHSSMAPSLRRLLESVTEYASEPHARAARTVLQALGERDIAEFDQYVALADRALARRN